MATIYLLGCKKPQNTTTINYQHICAAGSGDVITIPVDDAIIQSTSLKINTTPDPINSQRVDDMVLLFVSFIAILVSVWGLKQLLNLFSGDTSKD